MKQHVNKRSVRLFVTVYLFITPAQAASAGMMQPNVLVVHPPLYPLVAEIMRGSGAPEMLLSAGQDSHHIQLSPKQADKLARADVIILADRGMSVSLTKPIAARVAKGATVIAISELKGADPLTYRSQNHFTHADDHNDGNIDPHLWLDPVRMAGVVKSLAVKLGERNMAFDNTYRSNAETLATHLKQEVDAGIRTLLSAHPAARTKDTIAYIAYHDAYQYFEKRYELSPVGYITQKPESFIGAKAMKTLMESAEKSKVRCLIAESNSPLAKRFAIYTQAKTILLSPERLYSAKDAPSATWIRNDYDRLLAKVAYTFAGCISGSLAK
jgi:zinc transport system substrate-binding protein